MTGYEMFDNLYRTRLQGVLGELEVERVAARDYAWKVWKMLGVVAAVAFFFIWIANGEFFVYVVAAVLFVIAGLLFAQKRLRQVKGSVKNAVIPPMLDAMAPGLDYAGWDCIDEYEFNDCGLFQSPDRYAGKDLVEGMVGQTHVRFSLVHAEEEYEVTDTETDTDSDGNTTTRTVTRTEYRDIFCGLLFSADYNKHIHGVTRIYPGKAGLISAFYRSLVKLEDPRFNALFTAYGSDQVEARYILTPSFMERIMALRNHFGCGIHLSFTGSRVYVAVPMGFDAFELRMGRRLDEPEAVSVLFFELLRIIDIVDDLDLNTRIWSKRSVRCNE